MSLRRLSLLALLLLPACYSPESTAVRYHQALAQGDGKKALSLLSQSTREELERRARHAHEMSGGAIAANPAEMIVQGDDSLYPRGKQAADFVTAQITSAKENEATVEVLIDGARHELKLVREKSSWRIELPLDGTAR